MSDENEKPANDKAAETDAPETEALDFDAAAEPAEPEELKLSETETLQERLKAARREVDEMKDKVLRALAENENIRRRSQREKQDASKFAITNFARDLLSVADNLGRALDALPDDAKEDETFGTLVEGVELTGRELVSVFEKHGIKEVQPHGEKFDHNLHQAMFEVEDAEKPHGTVTEVMQIGYVLDDRLLRPAMVGVTKRPKPPEEPKVEEAEARDDDTAANASEAETE
ncbi:MAG: nucleotide exchange factor GrpE [Alphaproteobacteria bacterium]